MIKMNFSKGILAKFGWILAKWWNGKWPMNEVIYKAQGEISRDIRNLIPTKSYILEPVAKQWEGMSNDDKAFDVLNYVKINTRYIPDPMTHNTPEFWQHPEETIFTKKGDCIANYEEIYTKDGIKKVGNLKVGDLVLSYDFQKKDYVYKPIVKIWEKGKLPVKRVHFRNGTSVDYSEEHKFLVRKNQQRDIIYEERKIKDIDLSRWWKRKVPFAKSIPYEVKDIDWLTEDLCFVIGHFLAEGWKNSSNAYTSGYECDMIQTLLDKYDIPYSECNYGDVPRIRFRKSKFNDYLKTLLNNSFDINIPEEIFRLPKAKLNKLISGYFIGDGHYSNYPDKRGYSSNKEFVLSTSYEKFANDLMRIGLQIGVPFHLWKQENHQGLGNKPIYRLTQNSNSCFSRDYGYKGISEISIKDIENLPETEMRDFEVSDTHNFVVKNGHITLNCEDGSLLIISLLRMAGIPDWRVKICAGWVVSPTIPSRRTGHAYVIYLSEANNEWYVLDWCYYSDLSMRRFNKLPHRMCPEYQEIWWTCNDKHSWAQESTVINFG